MKRNIIKYKTTVLTMFMLLLLLVSLVQSKLLFHDEICELNGRRVYLELGSQGALSMKNMSKESGMSLATRNSLRDAEQVCVQCSMELVTCPACIIKITFDFPIHTEDCCSNSTQMTCCDDCIWVYEAPYESVSSKRFCGCNFCKNKKQPCDYYISQTRSVSITFVFNSRRSPVFGLKYSAERNRQFLTKATNNENNQPNMIASPYFPSFYPRDLVVEYVISCSVQTNCTITVVFTDFQISDSSIMEFYDWNGLRLYLTSGGLFRPPIMISSGPTMVIKFYANGRSNMGFKAMYSFASSAEIPDTNTDCGGYADNLGGAITMVDVIKENSKSYDCFWIIKPPKNYLNWKTHLYLSILTFVGFDNDTELVVREGVTSTEEPIEALRMSNLSLDHTQARQYITPITRGFYISLKGVIKPESKLVVVYSAFSYKDCFPGANFLCRNRRCISVFLHCDGFDHCGDNSDEPTACLRSSEGFQKPVIPHFYFPTINHYYDFKTAAIIFVVCSLGITGFIFGVIILLYRINMHNQNQRHFPNHLDTINAILEEGHTSAVEEVEIIIPDDPPLYEAPPTYDDIINKRTNSNKRKNEKGILSDGTVHASTSNNLQTTTISTICVTPPPPYALATFRQGYLRAVKRYKKDVKREKLFCSRKSSGRLLISLSDSDIANNMGFSNNTNVGSVDNPNYELRRSQSNESFRCTL